MKKILFATFLLFSVSAMAEETRAVFATKDAWIRGCTGNITDCYFSVTPGSTVYSRFTVADALPDPIAVKGGHSISQTDVDSRKAPFSGYHWVRSSSGTRVVYITE